MSKKQEEILYVYTQRLDTKHSKVTKDRNEKKTGIFV